MIEVDYAMLGIITAFAFVSVLAGLPLQGALVRYRVNYVPKTVRLLSSDDERGGQPEESSLRPRVPGFFRTLGRVKKIEVSPQLNRLDCMQGLNADSDRTGLGWRV